MRMFWEILCACITTGSFLTMLHYFWSARYRPEEFIELNDLRFGNESLKRIYFAFAWFGFVILVYGGLQSALYWLPDKWAYFENDLTKKALCALLSFYFSFFFMTVLQQAAEDRAIVKQNSPPKHPSDFF